MVCLSRLVAGNALFLGYKQRKFLPVPDPEGKEKSIPAWHLLGYGAPPAMTLAPGNTEFSNFKRLKLGEPPELLS